ncbi:MAG: MBL fold metallo-hydrolase [Deltaproteobacteria bacterium]|jgi:phosphoribosyl 1,2-cyclic phosphodiesterase|nr:MBL fold metallo-hydrolase [Deltaproteobacteria bacterium]
MKFSVLSSGSRGNSCYLETGSARILVDAGLSGIEIERRLAAVGVSPQSLDAIFVTHEHTDHIKGVGVLARRYNLPVYANQETLDCAQKALGKLPAVISFQTGETLTINNLSIETFTKCHDAADPMGLVFRNNGIKIGLVTDMGRSTRLAEDRLRACNVLVLEFNYDPTMLSEGPYPLDLKRRIHGSEGHLSNQQAGELLETLSHDDLEYLVLAHLSETNNTPDKALSAAKAVLKNCGLKGTRILLGKQAEPSPFIEL